jgi:hypothetical protein
MPSPPDNCQWWRPVGETTWRHVDEDPPPEPPTEVEWLRRKWPEPDWRYRNRAERGALASFRAPQVP